MEQKQVKIIGLKVNENFGILQSCNIQFDKDNNLIVVKGEVGSGKTTIQKAIQLGTLGSDTLRHDKNLYGGIDQEVQLLDGDLPVFVGCKSNEKGELAYVVYTKDADDKIIKNPVIDGVEITPAKYLKSLQTELTWRMDELTSESPTIQKKILLDLYKPDLAKAGVIYDKKHPEYVGSILDRIEKAEADRTEKEYARKSVGGFKHLLVKKGVDVDNPETMPKRIDIEALKSKRNKIQFELDNTIGTFEQDKTNRLQKVKNEIEEITMKLREENIKIQKMNSTRKTEHDAKSKRFTDGQLRIQTTCDHVKGLADEGIIEEEMMSAIIGDLNGHNNLIAPAESSELPLIPFDENKCTATGWEYDEEIDKLAKKLEPLREVYVGINNETFAGDNTDKEKEYEFLGGEITLAVDNNLICDGVDSFERWSAADKEVKKLKKEYAGKLKEINTGVDGLTIEMEEIGEKMNVHLMYNGSYSPEYFNNPKKDIRKLSSYSGTQKPMICLLIQNYLLSKKHKALRYLWIDNVPIDKKTRELLEEMGNKLNLTIIINITGDFNKDELSGGEILLEGGEVFFNKIEANE